MKKTITMAVKETENDFLNVINKSQLPACMLELILSKVLNEVKIISQKQYEMDIQTYIAQQNKMNNGEQNERGKISEEIKEDTTKERNKKTEK